MTHDTPSKGSSVFRGALRLGPALLLFLLFALHPAAAGCGGDGDDGAADGGDAGAAPGPDGSTARATGFVANPAGHVHFIEGFGGAFGDIYGRGAVLRDRADLPRASLLASEGDCEIWAHPPGPADCDPACQDQVCVAEDRCEPFPRLVSAGDIEVTGLTQELRFVPGEFGYVADPELPADPGDLFEDGVAITASAPGDDVPGFSLSAAGVAPLVADLDLEFDVTLVIEDGVDEVIRWEAESSGRVQLALQVGWHGAPYEAVLVCEVDDQAGELVVPGSLIARFPQRQNPTGEAHFHWIARFDRDVVESEAGPIELFVASRVLIQQIEHRSAGRAAPRALAAPRTRARRSP
jgi:hypothetical protein